MDTPPFILKPFGETVLLTCPYLISDMRVKEVADARCLAPTTIEDHTKIIREGMQCNNLYAALLRMVALGLITRKQLIEGLPPGWEQYILASCPCTAATAPLIIP